MVLLIALGSVFLVAALAAVCTMNARAIRRDVKQRYGQLQARLEHEANSLVEDMFDGDRPGGTG